MNQNKKENLAYIIPVIILIIILFFIFFFRLRIYKIVGSSMNPTLYENEFVLSYKTTYKRQDIIAFNHNQAIMIKRIIGLPKDKIDIKDDGTVYVNNMKISEPYINAKSLGKVEISFPYIVPENSYFVMGDNREHSLDSRTIPIGSINEEDIIGKVSLSLIPFKSLN